MDLLRPTVIGMTTPGKRTVLRKGSMGNISGISALLISSSSSELSNGKNSVSSFMTENTCLISNVSLLFIYICMFFRQYVRIFLNCCDNNIGWSRSEEHTSELQSRENLVCRLLLEKKNK